MSIIRYYPAWAQNEENLIRRAGVYALSGWLDDQGRMTDKISWTKPLRGSFVAPRPRFSLVFLLVL